MEQIIRKKILFHFINEKVTFTEGDFSFLLSDNKESLIELKFEDTPLCEKTLGLNLNFEETDFRNIGSKDLIDSKSKNRYDSIADSIFEIVKLKSNDEYSIFLIGTAGLDKRAINDLLLNLNNFREKKPVLSLLIFLDYVTYYSMFHDQTIKLVSYSDTTLIEPTPRFSINS